MKINIYNSVVVALAIYVANNVYSLFQGSFKPYAQAITFFLAIVLVELIF